MYVVHVFGTGILYISGLYVYIFILNLSLQSQAFYVRGMIVYIQYDEVENVILSLICVVLMN
jgi:hypothetical protein